MGPSGLPRFRNSFQYNRLHNLTQGRSEISGIYVTFSVLMETIECRGAPSMDKSLPKIDRRRFLMVMAGTGGSAALGWPLLSWLGRDSAHAHSSHGLSVYRHTGPALGTIT